MISHRFSQLRALAGRHRFGAVCVAISATLIIASGVLLQYRRSLSVLHSKRQMEGEAVLATMRSGAQLRRELALAREITTRIDANLVSDTEVEESVQYFYKMEDLTKVYFDEFHPLNVPIDNNPSFKRVPFAIRASGNYQQITAFIHAIETGPRLANITYFKLGRRGNNGLINLDVSLELLGKKP